MLYRQNHKKASAYIILSGLMFAIMGACIKLVSAEVSTTLIVFFRNFFGFITILPLVYYHLYLTENSDYINVKDKSLSGLLLTKKPAWHLIRSLFGLAAMTAFFYSISYIPLSESVLLSYTTPLFAPFMAYILLRERVHSNLAVAILLGFVGVFFLLNPEFKSLSWVSLIALSSGLFASVAMTSIRKMSSTEPIIRIVFYYGLICTLVSAIPLIWVEEWPNQNILLVLIVVGVTATFGQYFLTKGYSLAPVAQVGPFMYSTVVFATIIAWFFWQEIPALFSAFGIVLVVIAGSIALRKSVPTK